MAARPNNPATGTPTIIGTAQVGQELTADTSGIVDTDGLFNVSYSYQWIRKDGNADTEITNATDSSYTLEATDEGQGIKIKVSFADDAANEETMTSTATEAVSFAEQEQTDQEQTDNEAAPAKPDTPTLRALHKGMVEVDWNDVSGANQYEVQFYTSSGWLDIPNAGLGTEIFFHGSRGLATGLPEGLGYDAFHVRAGNSIGWSEWSEYAWQMTTHNMDWDSISVPTIEQTPKPVNSPATGAPTIIGTARVGETLTADTSGIADSDGLHNAEFSYQWIANDGSSDIDITDATDSTYILTAADEGQTIKVKVSFTDNAGNHETLTSTATAPGGSPSQHSGDR